MVLHAQPFSPAAGSAGSDAIHADDPAILSWVLSCDLERGPGIIEFPDSVQVTTGLTDDATGKADNRVLSLGDGGMATLYFEFPVTNGTGPDFAVFENSFDGNFLELAFVEVSSDNQHFVRFPAESLTQVDSQVATYGLMDPGYIQNLAGKYEAYWGTPFDLADLADSSGIDLQKITALRVIDVIGSLDEEYGSRDASGRMVNDPYPTPFGSGGFDLDAVGIMNHAATGIFSGQPPFDPVVYPIPCREKLYLDVGVNSYKSWTLKDMHGRLLDRGDISPGRTMIDMASLKPGFYFLECRGKHAGRTIRIIRSEM